MAPIRKNTITHFTHPAHKLTEIKSNEEFICDGCKFMGKGTRFNCSHCAFDLHEHCAKCPMTLTSHMHPSHPLRLMVHQVVSQRTRSCHACRKPIEGLVYQCTTKDCSFFVHPGCANSSPDTTTTYNNYNYTSSHEQRQGAPVTGISTGLAGSIAGQIVGGILFNAAYDGITGALFGADDTGGSGQAGDSSSDIPQQFDTDNTWSGQAGDSSSDIPQQFDTDNTGNGQAGDSSSDILQQFDTDDTGNGQAGDSSSDIPQQFDTDNTGNGQAGDSSSDIPQQFDTDDTGSGQAGGFFSDF